MKNDNELGYAQKTIVGAQFLFVAFGATVLVPLLVGLDPSVALFTAGVGTLIFHAVTKGKVPIFLGSSFAFIAPIVKATELFGLPGTLSGLVAVGAVYGITAYPTTFFVDAQGNLQAYYMGAMDAELLQQGIDMIYAEESE